MALITCPECGKEISDVAKACPYCGYPMNTEDVSVTEPQPVAVTSVSLGVDPAKKKKTMTIVICSALAVILVACVGIGINASKKAAAREAYITNLVAAQISMLTGAADAEGICNLTHDVWYNTIYEERSSETDPYTTTGTHGYYSSFHSDFNTSLATLYADDSMIEKVSEVKENQELVANLMKELQNPTEEFAACYETIGNMYSAYQNLTALAISPTGSLTSYTEDTHTYDSDFMTYYKKLETQIPEMN